MLPYAEYAIVDGDSTSVNVSLQRVGMDEASLRESVLAVDYPLAPFLAKGYT